MRGYALGSFHLQRLFLQERQNILHELVCWLTKKVLSARGQVGYNKKHNFELWYNVGIYLADRRLRKTDLDHNLSDVYVYIGYFRYTLDKSWSK